MSGHSCAMLMTAFLDKSRMLWTVLLGVKWMGLICFIQRPFQMAPTRCSVADKQRAAGPKESRQLSLFLETVFCPT